MVRHGDGLPRVSVARHIMLYECNVYGKAHFLLIIFVTVTVTVNIYDTGKDIRCISAHITYI